MDDQPRSKRVLPGREEISLASGSGYRSQDEAWESTREHDPEEPWYSGELREEGDYMARDVGEVERPSMAGVAASLVLDLILAVILLGWVYLLLRG